MNWIFYNANMPKKYIEFFYLVHFNTIDNEYYVVVFFNPVKSN